MADIQSAALLIGRLLVEEANYLYKVEDQVKELRDELEWMQCFLREVDGSQYDNAMARRWVAQIREYAYEAEDIIEKFLVKVIPRGSGQADHLLNMMAKFKRILCGVGALHQIGYEIEALKDKISALTSRLNTYGIKIELQRSSSSCLTRSRHNTQFVPKEKTTKTQKKLVSCLVDHLKMEKQTRICAIRGVGGVGKTFVAKEIFHHRDIRGYFKAFAWAYVSKPCQISFVQQKLLTDLTSKSSEQIAQMTDSELKDELCKVLLKQRSFVVLDGVWDKEVWNSLKEALPITNVESQSKLLLTTRLEELGDDVSLFELKCLRREETRELLQDIKPPRDTSAKKVDCEVLKKEMLEYCGGLPLVIFALKGVLATKKTPEEWERVHKILSSYSIDSDDHEHPQRRILELSYYELPYQLKPCFLYLGYFPTNLEISTRKVTRLWEAEGLVTPAEDHELSEDTLQDVAETCFSILVERSLVQVESWGLSGKPKTFRLHDLMQELCMSKASTGNWLNIVQLDKDEQPSGTPSSSKHSKPPKSSKLVKKKFRRLAIYCSDTLEKLPSDYRHARYIRSLLFFNTSKSEDVLISFKRKALRKAFVDFRLLRVLDIEYIEVQSLPKEVGFLIHLRYLSLKGSWVSKLPSTIKNLRCLQTLDLRVLSFVRLRIPDVIYMVDRLMHLYLPSKSFCLRGEAEKLRFEGLKSLETLVNFSDMCQAEDVPKLKNLRKFSSCDYMSGEQKKVLNFLASPSSTFNHSHIERMSLRLDGKILKDEPRKLEKCQHLRKLWVKGEIGESLEHVVLPQNLVQLSFWHSEFQHDPMQVLQKLPNLKRLSLDEASYKGNKMLCSKEGFKELSYLTLKGLAKLKDWEVEEKAMPKLVRLEISKCEKLKMIPEGLKFVTKLQELAISYMPVKFYGDWVPVNKLEDWDQYSKVKHIPYVTNSHVLDMSLQKQDD